ncbi:MAG TPA: response regulator [Clostridiaceae bacterium]|jgi:two-component system chemotaxis response regulator CheY|nr:response regulator [Clostridiaceae bacterium]
MSRILIVDDAAFMRTTIKMALEKAGHVIVGEAENGMEGLSQYIKLKPDLVTLDITMPVMNGIDALKAIRKYDNNAKVLMVSAMGQEGIVREAVLSGAKTFIVKPFSSEKLIQTVEKILSA